VAHAGLSEAQARERYGDRVQASTLLMEQVDRALTEGNACGFIKLVHQRNGSLLGATIVGARAGEMLQEWTIAMDQGLRVADLVESLHVYPTYFMGNMQLGIQIRVAQFLESRAGRLIQSLARLTR
jgi:pyruvate/2-oxoglutarate dehydrogenase complex dihydrolipoamide dehydrogenase (E3) component